MTMNRIKLSIVALTLIFATACNNESKNEDKTFAGGTNEEVQQIPKNKLIPVS